MKEKGRKGCRKEGKKDRKEGVREEGRKPYSVKIGGYSSSIIESRDFIHDGMPPTFSFFSS